MELSDIRNMVSQVEAAGLGRATTSPCGRTVEPCYFLFVPSLADVEHIPGFIETKYYATEPLENEIGVVENTRIILDTRLVDQQTTTKTGV
jgi:hypothetical protein